MIEKFLESIREAGLNPDCQIIADGVFHRERDRRDKAGKKDFWYIFFPDDAPCGKFGHWKYLPDGKKWTGKAETTITPEECHKWRERMEQAGRERKKADAERHEECRKRSEEIWDNAEGVVDHPYLERKGVNAYGLKQYKDTLIVPVRDVEGTLHGLQFIGPDGEKRFKTGTDKAGHFFHIGKKKDDTYIVAEGFATAASIHQATEHCVIVAFDAGNLGPVAEAVKAVRSDSKFIIAADDDAWEKIKDDAGNVVEYSPNPPEKNTGIIKATAAAHAVNGLLAVPIFPDTRGPKDTDFNDLARLAGPEAVLACLEDAATPTTAPEQENPSQAGMECQEPADTTPVTVEYRRMSDITAKPIHWLWQGRFARGKVSILAGHPGLGKSQVVASMAAIVTTGGSWPVDRTQCETGNVIILSAEDDAADTIRPRLEAAGADLDRVFILDAVIDSAGGRRSFNLALDLERLDKMIANVGGAALISIDPITAYLGGTDSHKNADMRALLSPLGELAAKRDAAIIGVSHLNKCGGGEALTRIMGSLAFVAASRAAYLIIKDNNNPKKRFFLPVKNNIGNDSTGLAFTIVSKNLSVGIETSAVIWEAVVVTVTADEAMQPQGNPKKPRAIDDAMEFLSNILAEGPLSVERIKSDAEGAGYAWATVRRAKKALGIEATKEGMKGPWIWKLQPKMLNNAEDAQANSVSTLGNDEHLQERSEGQLDLEDLDIEAEEEKVSYAG